MTIKKTLLGAASVAALALAVSAAPAAAEDREFGWSITIGGTSDYVFRGTSFTNGDPAAQGSIDFSYGIIYAGAWASNIDGNSEPWELDLYVGVKPTLGPVTFDFAVLGYLYPASEENDGNPDYLELKAGASMELVKSLTGTVNYYYQFGNDSAIADAQYVEGTLAYALPQMGIFSPSVSGTIGYAVADDSDSVFIATAGGNPLEDQYVYWNVGLSLTVEKFTMDFRYWDTDISDSSAGGNGNFFADETNADERFVFTAKVTLP